jgi:hypothetical protein
MSAWSFIKVPLIATAVVLSFCFTMIYLQSKGYIQSEEEYRKSQFSDRITCDHFSASGVRTWTNAAGTRVDLPDGRHIFVTGNCVIEHQP